MSSKFSAFLKELRRRRVIRALLVYSAAALAVVQVADVVSDRLPQLAWAFPLILALVFLGVPLAGVLAWVFEITPDGIRRTGTAAATEVAPAGHQIAKPLSAFHAPSHDPEGVRSVCVLPFTDMSGDGPSYFADGITEELINLLAQLQALRVVSRTSSFALRGVSQDARDIGQKLGVDIVLDGSVRREGSRVRINAQLVDTGSGFQLWTRSFDREVTSLLELQQEISSSIADALQTDFGETNTRATRSPRIDAEAYDLYLRGLFARNSGTGQGLGDAVAFFQKSVVRAPELAAAYAATADTYALMALSGFRLATNVFPLAKSAASQALALDPLLADAHAALGYALLFHDFDWSGAQQEFQRAVELNPSHTTARVRHALLLAARGHVTESLLLIDEAAGLDPLSAVVHYDRALLYAIAGRKSEALAAAQASLILAPDSSTAHAVVGMSYLFLSLHDDAAREFERVARLEGRTSTTLGLLAAAHALRGRKLRAWWLLHRMRSFEPSFTRPFPIAVIQAALGRRDQALHWLEKAYAQRDPWVIFLDVLPPLKSLRSQPRFMELVERLGMRAP